MVVFVQERTKFLVHEYALLPCMKLITVIRQGSDIKLTLCTGVVVSKIGQW